MTNDPRQKDSHYCHAQPHAATCHQHGHTQPPATIHPGNCTGCLKDRIKDLEAENAELRSLLSVYGPGGIYDDETTSNANSIRSTDE